MEININGMTLHDIIKLNDLGYEFVVEDGKLAGVIMPEGGENGKM